MSGTIWITILALGIGTYVMRFSFLAVMGSNVPRWALRLLRFVPVAVLPALVAPLVVWPQATGGEPDAARLLAAGAALAVGITLRNPLAAIAAGLATLMLGLWVL